MLIPGAMLASIYWGVAVGSFFTFGLNKSDLRPAKFFKFLGLLASAYVFWSLVAELTPNFGPGGYQAQNNLPQSLGLALVMAPVSFIAVSVLAAIGTYMVVVTLIRLQKSLKHSGNNLGVPKQKKWALVLWFAGLTYFQVYLNRPVTFETLNYINFAKYTMSFLTVALCMFAASEVRRAAIRRQAQPVRDR